MPKKYWFKSPFFVYLSVEVQISNTVIPSNIFKKTWVEELADVLGIVREVFISLAGKYMRATLL